MDIKAEVQKLITKFTGDPELLGKFKKDPVGTVKSVVGDKVSPEDVKKIADSVKEKLPDGPVGDAIDKITGLLG